MAQKNIPLECTSITLCDFKHNEVRKNFDEVLLLCPKDHQKKI